MKDLARLSIFWVSLIQFQFTSFNSPLRFLLSIKLLYLVLSFVFIIWISGQWSVIADSNQKCIVWIMNTCDKKRLILLVLMRLFQHESFLFSFIITDIWWDCFYFWSILTSFQYLSISISNSCTIFSPPCLINSIGMFLGPGVPHIFPYLLSSQIYLYNWFLVIWSSSIYRLEKHL